MTRLPDCGSTECSLAAHVADQQDRGRRYPAGTLSACNQLVSPVFLVGGCAAVAARAQLHAVCNRGTSHQTAYTVHLHRSGLLRSLFLQFKKLDQKVAHSSNRWYYHAFSF